MRAATRLRDFSVAGLHAGGTCRTQFGNVPMNDPTTTDASGPSEFERGINRMSDIDPESGGWGRDELVTGGRLSSIVGDVDWRPRRRRRPVQADSRPRAPRRLGAQPRRDERQATPVPSPLLQMLQEIRDPDRGVSDQEGTGTKSPVATGYRD